MQQETENSLQSPSDSRGEGDFRQWDTFWSADGSAWLAIRPIVSDGILSRASGREVASCVIVADADCAKHGLVRFAGRPKTLEIGNRV